MVEIKAADGLIVTATVLGPILAVQAQKMIERLSERNKRQNAVFDTLMATRGARLSPDHVKALNQIELVFYGVRRLGRQSQSAGEKEVVMSWRTYFDHLSHGPETPMPEQLQPWTQRGDDLFVALLSAIARHLKYDFDDVLLRRGVYSPRMHGEQEQLILEGRKNLSEVLRGERAIKMEVTALPPQAVQ